jgi:hypothetical protein
LYGTWKEKLFWAVNPEDLEDWCDAVLAKGAPLDNCFGFIDGLIEEQRVVYNGHKRIHSIKFQSIVSPSGMIVSLYGPVEGRRHDITLYRHSKVEDKLKELNEQYGVCIYGDPAYMLRPWLITPHKGGILNSEQSDFNKEMSQVRLAVEWGSGKVLSIFAFLNRPSSENGAKKRRIDRSHRQTNRLCPKKANSIRDSIDPFNSFISYPKRKLHANAS